MRVLATCPTCRGVGCDDCDDGDVIMERFGWFCVATHFVWPTLGRTHEAAGCCYPVFRRLIERRPHSGDIPTTREDEQ